jgi:hypothetical protein
MTCEPTYYLPFVNVYLIDRAYGGPEEGGWHYECGEAVRSTQVRNTTASCQELLLKDAGDPHEEEGQALHGDRTPG